MFVFYTSICRKMIWGLTTRTSRIGYRGLGSGVDRIVVCCTDVVVQWLARGTGRGGKRAHGIGRRSSLFRAPQALCRLGEVINIVPSIEIGRRGRSYRVDGSLWAIEKARVYYYTLGTKTTVIDFDFRGT
jgi:hypothetical protein